MENKSTDILTIIKITGAFLAFLIGSGFATGQEAMQFFVVYGYKGVAGGAITMVLFIYLTYTLMKLGKDRGFKRNEEVFQHYAGKILGTGFTWYTMIFIVTVAAIMMSGAGATLEQAYGIPLVVGSGIMAVMVMVTILLGLNKLIDIIGTIGPIIVIATIFIALVTIIQNGSEIATGTKIVDSLEVYKASNNWILSGILYVGLSILGMASFLPAVGTSIERENDLKYSSVLGPILFSGGLILISLALLSKLEMVYQTAIPILALADSVLPIYGAIFAVIIFLGIFTTVTPLTWTVCARFSEEGTTKYKVISMIIIAIAYFGGMLLPFAKLVNIIYPTIGYAGSLLLALIIYKDVKKLFVKESEQKESVCKNA